MIVTPQLEEEIDGPSVLVKGWAWYHEPIERVRLSVDAGISWKEAVVGERVDFSWQMFSLPGSAPRAWASQCDG